MQFGYGLFSFFFFLVWKWIVLYFALLFLKDLGLQFGSDSKRIFMSLGLNLIQAKTGDSNARIFDFFDIISRTGIGALLAVMLNANDGNGRPLFAARDVVTFVNDRRTELFKVKTVAFFVRD
ncbi:hypothetical protein L2E82_03372 [Cichorium intybus]|uniref:Uncharacterized protein n=1 Tax=Cichorium intybus TaxID=13427 RepID=A0ACB9H3R3_CICIN|nr:hypothetical protein L2E82_03372 [Cichorium intybus]